LKIIKINNFSKILLANLFFNIGVLKKLLLLGHPIGVDIPSDILKVEKFLNERKKKKND